VRGTHKTMNTDVEVKTLSNRRGWVGRGSGVRDPHTKFNTRHIYSFMLFHLFQTAVNYQLFFNFLMTSKFVVLDKKKNRRRFASVVIQDVTLTLIAIIMADNFFF